MRLDDYSEIATALQVFDKDFIYTCVALAGNTSNIVDLVCLVDNIASKESKEDILDFFIVEGKEKLKTLTNEMELKEVWGNPRDSIKLNYSEVKEKIHTNSTLDTISLLVSAGLTRDLEK